MKYHDGTFPKPEPADSTASASEIASKNAEIRTWNMEDLHAKHLLQTALGDGELIHLQGSQNAAEAWRQLKEIKEPKGLTAIVDAVWKLYDTRCPDGGSVTDHVTTLRSHLQEVSTLGERISDKQFAFILTKSLPRSWDVWTSSFWASKSETDEIKSSEIISRIMEEDRRRKSRDTHDEVANMAAQNRGKRANPNGKYCTNCKRTNHTKEECFSKGGGKEGQGPRQLAKKKRDQEKKEKDEKEKKDKETANPVIEPNLAFASQPMFNSIFPRDAWLADSGASSHIANDIQMFNSITLAKIPIQGIGSTIEALGRGTVTLISKLGSWHIPIILNDVIYAPNAPNCLLSLYIPVHYYPIWLV